MTPSWSRLLALLAALAAASGMTPATGAAQSGTPENAARIDQMFAPWDRPDSPGAAVLVIRDGKVVHRKGYGMADLEHAIPIRPDTVFDLASVSKQFCGLSIAVLAEQGRLKLTDDVRKFVPWVPKFSGAEAAPTPIQIQHLVHHTSGIRDWPGALRLAGWKYEDVISFDQILHMLRKQEDLNFPPGAEYSYSNTGYNLLAKVVQNISGTSFANWTRTQLFDPLGMRSTHFQDDHTRVVPKRATAYRRVQSRWHRVGNQLTAVGSSSLFSTIDDLAKWILNFETKKVGGAAALARMHTPGKLNDGDTIAYCYGVKVEQNRGLATISHSGSWAGFRTFLLRYPEQRLAVVVLANTATVRPRRKAHGIAELYLKDAMAPLVQGSGDRDGKKESPAWKPTKLEEYEGSYFSPELDTTYRVVRRGGKLRLTHFRNETITLRPSSQGDRFLGGVSWLATLQFLRKNGKITGYEASNGRCRDVRFSRLREGR